MRSERPFPTEPEEDRPTALERLMWAADDAVDLIVISLFVVTILTWCALLSTPR